MGRLETPVPRKVFPEMQELLCRIAREEISGSIPRLSGELNISVAEFVVNAVPRVKFMIKNLSILLKQLEKY